MKLYNSGHSTYQSSCPICSTLSQAPSYIYHHATDDHPIFKCHACLFEFMRPLPLIDLDERRMNSVDDAEMFNNTLLRKLHEKLIVWPEIRKIRKLLGRDGFTMLDVGCGTGWISRIWAESGAEVTGLEPSPTRAAIARQRGLRVLPCYAEELSIEEHFDLIVIRHVVEHLEDPARILRTLIGHLNPEGVLLTIVPNIDCVGRKIFDTHWTWVLPWHCNFFSPTSMQLLLDHCGYKVEKLYQTPSPLWYPESFARKFPRIGAFLTTAPLSMVLFAPLIVFGWLSGFSDNITAIARPKQKDHQP